MKTQRIVISKPRIALSKTLSADELKQVTGAGIGTSPSFDDQLAIDLDELLKLNGIGTSPSKPQ